MVRFAAITINHVIEIIILSAAMITIHCSKVATSRLSKAFTAGWESANSKLFAFSPRSAPSSPRRAITQKTIAKIVASTKYAFQEPDPKKREVRPFLTTRVTCRITMSATMLMPVNQVISSTKKLYGTKCPIIGRTKCGSKIWPYAVTKVPKSETKPTITNQCAIPDPVKFNILA